MLVVIDEAGDVTAVVVHTAVVVVVMMLVASILVVDTAVVLVVVSIMVAILVVDVHTAVVMMLASDREVARVDVHCQWCSRIPSSSEIGALFMCELHERLRPGDLDDA